MILKKGYYTCDINETYWYVEPLERNGKVTIAEVEMFYKSGQYKDYSLGVEVFELDHKNITHWYEYDPKKDVDKCDKVW